MPELMRMNSKADLFRKTNLPMIQSVRSHNTPILLCEKKTASIMMGSSMGGLISLYALCEYPQVFGGVACLSTHLSFDHLDYGTTSDQWAEAFRQYVSRQLPPYGGHMVYMDHGTEGLDGEYAEHQERLDSVFKAQGWDRKHYLSRVFEGHEHKEIFWSKRLEQPLLFLLGK